MEFEFLAVPRLVFGAGQFRRLGELAAGLGRNALVVTNAGKVSGAALAARLSGLLTAAGVRHVLQPQEGEPVVEDVDRGAERSRREGCDLVIAVGGGSALDTAKAIAGLLTNGGGALDYMEVVGRGQRLTRPAAPWIAVPTTAGTGAEATRNAVIGCPERHFKASLRSEHLLARVALVDPELTLSVPPDVTAATGLDALTQLIESYTSNRAQPLTDALALTGLRHAARGLRRAWRDGADLAARTDMALAAHLSGMTLANAGLGAVHGFAAPLGARFPVPHGTACACLLPHVLAANVAALRAQGGGGETLARYAQIGRLLAGRADLAEDAAVEAAVQATAELVRELRIPGLRMFGLQESDVPALAGLAQKASSMRYNPVVLPAATLEQILRAAM